MIAKNRRPRLLAILDRMHLIYLGVLPAVATWMTLSEYGHRFPFLLFLGGVVIVSVYLVVIASYPKPAASLNVALLALLDGPLWAVSAQFFGWTASANGLVASIAVDAFLVDGVAIWIAIAWLAVSTSRPTCEQRIATLVFAVIAVATAGSQFWPYLRENLWGNWISVGWLVLGIGEAVVAHYFLLAKDHVQRDEAFTMPYILIFLLFWLVAMIAGMVVYEL